MTKILWFWVYMFCAITGSAADNRKLAQDFLQAPKERLHPHQVETWYIKNYSPEVVDGLFGLLGSFDPNDVINDFSPTDYFHALGIIGSVDHGTVDFGRLKQSTERFEQLKIADGVKVSYLAYAYLAIGRYGTTQAIDFLEERSRAEYFGTPPIQVRPPMESQNRQEDEYVSPYLDALRSINALGREAETKEVIRLKNDPRYKTDRMAQKYIELAVASASERAAWHEQSIRDYSERLEQERSRSANSARLAPPLAQASSKDPIQASSAGSTAKTPERSLDKEPFTNTGKWWVVGFGAILACIFFVFVLKKQ